jgi:hypothetical protein
MGSRSERQFVCPGDPGHHCIPCVTPMWDRFGGHDNRALTLASVLEPKLD